MSEPKLLFTFDTCQCLVKVYDTNYEVDFCSIYMVKSHHLKNGKVLIRFGTKAQVQSILNTYKMDKRFSL